MGSLNNDKKKMKKNMMTRTLLVSRFTRGVLVAHNNMILLAISIARHLPVEDFWLVVKVWLDVLGKCCGVLYADHMKFYLRHLYNILISTDVLIIIIIMREEITKE